MIAVIASTWALLIGVLLLMIGNGVQGTLLGIRGDLEGFSTTQLSVVMSAYFAGFLIASQLIPGMLRRVGHVRVFAALGSFIAAVIGLYPLLPQPVAWALLRVVVGFSFCGVYITAESWLNNAVSNHNRGKALSLYMLAQMTGIISAQGIIAVTDPAGFVPFVVVSVLVSLAIAPVLLTALPAPAFAEAKPLPLRELFRISPLTCTGMFLVGGIFSAQFGMSGVWGTHARLSVAQISLFVSMIYLGGLLLQFPIGWISDRMDRRKLIMIVALCGGAAGLLGTFAGGSFLLWLVAGFLLGGLSNPLYSLLIAYANDYMEHSQMPAASAGFLLVNGVGALLGPVALGWAMEVFGNWAYFLFIGALMFVLAGYAGWRMRQRPRDGQSDSAAFVALAPETGALAVETAQHVGIEKAAEQAPEDEPSPPEGGPGASAALAEETAAEAPGALPTAETTSLPS